MEKINELARRLNNTLNDEQKLLFELYRNELSNLLQLEILKFASAKGVDISKFV